MGVGVSYHAAVLRDADLVAFAAATDLEASRRFYADVLGLELLDSNPSTNVFDANGTRLRVIRVEQLGEVPYTVLGWRVEDIHATIATLESRGVEFLRYPGFEQDAAGVWRAPSGNLIAWFSDPDGNGLSLEQPSVDLDA
jgi:catechol 2,3-dioxygenase-like lactoylglutathione lyase family enzyme